MTRMPRRPASSLVATVVLFATCTVTTITAQNCVPYNSSYTAGTPDETPIAVPSYFRCPDDGFLLTVDASYYTSIYSLSWTCSGGEEIGSFSSASSGDSFAALTGSGVADEPVSFSVAITEVSTEVQDYALPLLSHTHFGGYDVDTTGADITFSWGDSFGYSDEENVYLPDEYFSFCSSGSFATGVTVWSSSNYVYGVMLECAYATATCLPPNYPTSLLADSSSSTTDPATSAGSTVPVISTPSPFFSTSSGTDPPSPPTSSSVVATGTPNPYGGGTAPTFDTPSPSAITSSGADTPSPSAISVSTRSSSSSASTIVVGASVAGGLCFLAICAGLICGCHQRESRKTRHSDKPRDTFGAPAATGGGEGGGGIAPKDGTVTHVVDDNEDPVAADPSPPDEPPPPYSEHPRFRQAPPPYPSDLA